MKQLSFLALASAALFLGACNKMIEEWLRKYKNININGSPVIVNANFEKPIDFNNLPADAPWYVQSYVPASAIVAWGNNIGKNNTGGISLEAGGGASNDISVIQQFLVDPRKFYRVTAWVKTENVNGGAGANICAYGTWIASDPVTGTSDWHKIAVALPPDSGEATIACRLGFWGGTSTGKAYFDDLVLNEQFTQTGQHVRVVLDPDDASAVPRGTIVNWVSELDKAYLKYAELMGGYPDNGNIITVLSVTGNPGGWAVAGNPTLWYEPYVKGELQTIQSTGTWSFGIMHELGHDFVLPGTNKNWIWNEEMFANFRMYYVVEKLNATIAEGSLYHGTELENYYKTDASGSYANGIAKGIPKGDDGVMYTLLRIKDIMGWDLIKKAMADLSASSVSPGSGGAKFNLFLDKLSQYSGMDVRTTYLPGELNTIQELLNNE